MKPQLHHIAINVKDIDWYCNFFCSVFHMEIRKTAGETPHRQIWFHEGIQLNERNPVADGDNAIDHLSISVDDIDSYCAKAQNNQCTPVPDKRGWFMLPNGLKVELVTFANT